MRIISIISIICLFSFIFEAKGQKEYPPHIENAQQINYKTVNGTKLSLWVFNPQNHEPTDKTPVIIFFFGGGWTGGSPEQFVKHCEYLAARGMVAIVADYRVKSRNNVTANECVSDAKSAIRWVRANASKLGIDSNKIVASGGSAGGHLAASTAILPKFDDEHEDLSISSKPNALVLFNPVLIVAPVKDMEFKNNEESVALEKRLGAKPDDMSPYHQLVGNLPPTIIFHGTDDKTVPFKTIELFTNKMHELGNKCTLVAYKGESHGFFNYGEKSNALFVDTVHRMDEFLVSLGYLNAAPEKIVYKNVK